MPLSWNEIKTRAIEFSKEWEGESRERAEKDSFWNDFFNVFGISRRRVAAFEKAVKKLNNKQGFIDLFWKGTLLIEHKSKGKDLGKALDQALDYFPGLKEHELPKYILVSDFHTFILYDLEEKTDHEFSLSEFINNVHLFGFIAGYEKRTYKDEDPVNIDAAYLMGQLHDSLEDVGYTDHALEVYLVRLLFCLFADDTGIFERGIFQEYIDLHTKEDGSDLALHIAQIFQVLNTPKDKRLSNLDENQNQFPYVNGQLFAEVLPFASFNSKMREMLLEACYLDWGKISPAIFGSMFQAAMNQDERRNLGAHYTSEKNIQKLIKPLFLDQLYNEFKKAKGNSKKLQILHNKIAGLKFLDPACGCGNFLIITYRELRDLEIKILRELYKSGQGFLNVGDIIQVDVDQFYGIEYDEFPVRIAEVAMWLIDHQMNMKVSEEFGQYFVRLPLKKAAKIVQGNALRTDWEELVPKIELNYILGNPPFYGSKNQTREQKEDMKLTFGKVKGAGVLDYVTAWYIKASKYIQNTDIDCAFVSTNSITQGEQVGVLWTELMRKYAINIHFAYRTFNWKNEAKGNAAVHVVIIGFTTQSKKNKRLFDYEDINGEPQEISVKNINPYLVDAVNILVASRSNPLCTVNKIVRGSETTDKGNFILSEEEKNFLLEKYPRSSKFIKKFQGGGDIINNRVRWCLWLKDVNVSDYRGIPLVMDKIKSVKAFRESSSKERTRKWADFPTLFSEDRQPSSDFLAIPKVSSARRKYIPIEYMSSDVIINNTVSALPDANLYYFGVLTSVMHMTWMKYTCGRMKSDYIYSIQVVYNNFPWAKSVKQKNKEEVETAAQKVLDTRAKYPNSSLADLYDPLTMPPELVKAHQALDKAVDLCYRPQPFTNERNRIEFLFELYEQYTMPLMKEKKKKTRTPNKA